MRRRLEYRNASKIAFAALTIGSALYPSIAAAGAKEECISAYEQAQDLRKQSRLISAHERILVCAREVCPAVLRKDCIQWLEEVERSMPTVVLEVKGANGSDLVAVKVYLDGKLVAEQLDGRPIQLDPGQHTFRFEIAGAPPKEERIVVPEGTKNRHVTVSFASAAGGTTPIPSAPVSPAEAPVPTATYVLGGLGVVGLASFAIFGLSGNSKQSSLDSKNCKPYCAQEDVDSIKQNYLFADISLGVGAASLVAASIIYFTRSPASPEEATPANSVSLGVTPAIGGGFATLGGRF